MPHLSIQSSLKVVTNPTYSNRSQDFWQFIWESTTVFSYSRAFNFSIYQIMGTTLMDPLPSAFKSFYLSIKCGKITYSMTFSLKRTSRVSLKCKLSNKCKLLMTLKSSNYILFTVRIDSSATLSFNSPKNSIYIEKKG